VLEAIESSSLRVFTDPLWDEGMSKKILRTVGVRRSEIITKYGVSYADRRLPQH
jgi:cytoskeletal protein RodZ